MPAFYPMPSFPILEVNDIEASMAWYRDVLGFSVVFAMPGPSGVSLVHLRWAQHADLMLRRSPDLAGPKGIGVTLNFAVANGLDALAARARTGGAHITVEPANRPWNARDFTLSDIDGYRLTFTMGPLNSALTIEDVTQQSRF